MRCKEEKLNKLKKAKPKKPKSSPLYLKGVDRAVDEAWRDGYQQGYSEGYDEGYKKGLEEGVSQGFRRGHGRIEFIKFQCPHCKHTVLHPFFKGPFSKEIQFKDEFLKCPHCKSALPKALVLKAYSETAA